MNVMVDFAGVDLEGVGWLGMSIEARPANKGVELNNAPANNHLFW